MIRSPGAWSSITVTDEVINGERTGNDPLHNGSNSETDIRRSVIRGGTGRAGGTVTSS